ncbi:MAG TPA: peroxiredoxin [Hyphomicrobium sp.]|nr:peroxiredoxin [Hyphomicrobium sp.]
MARNESNAAGWPWPAPEDDGAAKHIIPGTRLPDVALGATRGAAVNLARYQERAIVFVYPFAGTPGEPNPPHWDEIAGAHGSTAEAEGFRDCYAAFRVRGYEVFGLSTQESAVQQAFATRAGLPYLLLSDKHLAVADALELPRFETGGVTYLTRLTLVVRNGVIYRCIYPVHPPDMHAASLLSELA